MTNKTKVFVTAFATFLVLSLTLVSLALGAGAITLTPSTQATGGSVSVGGTGFGSTKAVAIGFGAEVAGTDANMAYSGTGMGPYSGRVSNYPIKPGSFVLTSDTSSGAGIVSTYTDNGDGTTTWSYDGTTMGTINYVTGAWSRSTTVDVTGIATNYSAIYTRYQFNVTSAAGVTTDASGAFTTPITVPAVADGNYVVTAVDTSGNKGTSTLIVIGVIPENLSVGVMMLASTVAVVAGALYLRKRPRSENHS